MKDGERVVNRLSECGKIMADGQFSAYDLDYIKQALGMMLNATNNVIKKNNKQLQQTDKSVDE